MDEFICIQSSYTHRWLIICAELREDIYACVCAGIVAYHTEQEFGTWHIWVPIVKLRGSGGTADDFIVRITASDLSVGVSNSAPYLEVIAPKPTLILRFPCPRLRCILMLGHDANADS